MSSETTEHTEAPPAQPHTQTATLPRPVTRRDWLWNVVLLDDNDHTDLYVVRMMAELFGKKVEDGKRIAVVVDTDGRAVCLTTHKEHAELKRDQIHAFGRDPLIAHCAGAMRAVIEPAERDGDDDHADNR